MKGYAEFRPEFRHRSETWADLPVIRVRDVLAAIATWRARAGWRRELAMRSERELLDMGTCWSSIADEIGKPFWRS